MADGSFAAYVCSSSSSSSNCDLSAFASHIAASAAKCSSSVANCCSYAHPQHCSHSFFFFIASKWHQQCHHPAHSSSSSSCRLAAGSTDQLLAAVPAAISPGFFAHLLDKVVHCVRVTTHIMFLNHSAAASVDVALLLHLHCAGCSIGLRFARRASNGIGTSERCSCDRCRRRRRRCCCCCC